MLSKSFLKNIDNWSTTAQSVLYPPTCFICEQQGHNGLDLCLPCFKELKPARYSCLICDIKLPAESSLCGRCLKNPPSFDQVITLYRYKGLAQHLIQSLKFQSKHSCARILGQLMAHYFKSLKKNPDALIAVPLHPKRLRRRGFNQCDLIAQHIHHELGIPLIHNQLKRIINTQSQVTLTAKERQKNLNNAFRYLPAHDIKTIALIDDVVTTGSTANEIAKTLKKQGVQQVEIWAFARA
ncbi:MAG: ComF family protein [Cycloclasticus sp.]